MRHSEYLAVCLSLLVGALAWSQAPLKFASLEELEKHALAELEKLSVAERVFVEWRLAGDEIIEIDPSQLREGAWGVVTWAFRVSQVLDGKRAIIEIEKRPYLYHGPQENYSDDRWYEAKDRVLMMHGTGTFRTVLGANRTLPVLWAVNTPEAQKAIQRANFIRSATKFDAVGEAAFLELKAGQVTFKLLDNSEVRHKLTELSDADRAWITKFLASERDLERKRRAENARRLRTGK
jgi:hypothetical protein